MKTLILMRHAKSAWDDPHQKDIDRPLAPRGRKAAPRMGAWLADEGFRPDLVLCSTARRAQETLELVKPSLPKGVEIRLEREIYMAAPRELLTEIGKAADQAKAVMLVGHNPGLGNLASSLAATGEPRLLAQLHNKFPTGAVAVLTFATERWSEVTFGNGTLAAFLRPRDRA